MINPRVEAILRAPEAFLANGRILKPSRSSAVSAANNLVLKRDNYRKPLSRIKDAFRGSRAWRSFQKACLLELAGVPTARAVAAAELRRWGLIRCSYLLMEEIAGAVPLDQYSGSRREALVRVADLLAKLHQTGFSHRDLKAGNIIFDHHHRPHLIDLDGLSFHGDTPDGVAAADLARLLGHCAGWPKPLSGTDCLRFLRRYCRRRKRADWRWWWRAIRRNLDSGRGAGGGLPHLH
jgi:tRNA A-37 threonylcarbamoyl transferase component Bud32